MKKANFAAQAWLVVGVGCMVAASYTNAYARDNGRSHHQGREVVVVGHDRYHYQNGRFYRPSWFGIEFTIGTPPFGAVVSTIPFGYRTVVVRNTPYYYYDNIYYQRCPAGYTVVQKPVMAPEVIYVPVSAQAQQSSRETVTVNVPRSSGGYMPITLLKTIDGYVGPQGEYYAGNPTVEQLRLLYGR